VGIIEIEGEAIRVNVRAKQKLPDSFFELIKTSELPVLVDFWAEWCGPCRIVSPTIERLAHEFSGKLLTVKVNVDKRPNIAESFQVQSIPTIALFWKGEQLMRFTGAYPYDAIRSQLVECWPKDAADAIS
jgi:thioredoxin 1